MVSATCSIVTPKAPNQLRFQSIELQSYPLRFESGEVQSNPLLFQSGGLQSNPLRFQSGKQQFTMISQRTRASRNESDGCEFVVEVESESRDDFVGKLGSVGPWRLSATTARECDEEDEFFSVARGSCPASQMPCFRLLSWRNSLTEASSGLAFDTQDIPTLRINIARFHLCCCCCRMWSRSLHFVTQLLLTSLFEDSQRTIMDRCHCVKEWSGRVDDLYLFKAARGCSGLKSCTLPLKSFPKLELIARNMCLEPLVRSSSLTHMRGVKTQLPLSCLLEGHT